MKKFILFMTIALVFLSGNLSAEGLDARVLWESIYNGGYDDVTPYERAFTSSTNSVATDSAGNSVVVGISFDGNQWGAYTVKYAGDTGNILWSNATQNISYNIFPIGVTVDSNDDIFVVGNLGSGTEGTYVIKYSGIDGNIQWEKIFPQSKRADDMILDETNDLILTGTEFSLIWPWPTYFYTSKYDGITGDILWEKTSTDDKHCQSYAVATDNTEDIFVTGFCATVNFQDHAYYTVKYNGNDGALLWQSTLNSDYIEAPSAAGYDVAMDIATEMSGDVFVTGTSYVVKYDGRTGGEIWKKTPGASGGSMPAKLSIDFEDNLIAAGGGKIVKYRNSTGEVVWANTFQRAEMNSPFYITVDKGNNILLVAEVHNGDTWSLYNYDYRTTKYHGITGRIFWEKDFKGIANAHDVPSGITAGPFCNVIVTGKSYNGANYDLYTVKYAGGPSGCRGNLP